MLITGCVPHSPWPTDWLPTCISALTHHHHNYADVQDHWLLCSCWGSGTSSVWHVLPCQFLWGLALCAPGQILVSSFVISEAKKSVCLALSIRTTTTHKHHHILVHVFTGQSIPSSKKFGPNIKDVTQAFILEVKFAYWPLFHMYLSSSLTTKYSQCPKIIPDGSSQLSVPWQARRQLNGAVQKISQKYPEISF